MIGDVFTKAELQELTACKQRAAVLRILDKNNTFYEIAADGWPRVLRSELAPKTPLRFGVVYLVEAIGAKALKIGFTQRDPRLRLKSLQTATPNRLRLIDLKQGTQHLETRIHELCAKDRIRGEWFRDRKRVRRAFARVQGLNLAVIGFRFPSMAEISDET